MPEMINWNEKFSVDVEKIDEQHKILIEMLNQLLDHTTKFSENDERHAIQKTLDDMASYIDFHFKSEEEYLKHHPNFQAHRFEHWEFVKKTLKFIKDFKEQKANLSDEVCDFLFGWLRLHILNSDVKEFQYLSENGLLIRQEN